MTDIKSMNMEELKELMVQIGEKPFRAKQIYGWLHEHLVTSYDEMANIPKSLKEKLKDYPITALEELDVQTSKVDGTRKYLFRLSDGNMIESVLMRYKYGNSVCISSQAGCRMGCRFCASTIGGLTRNLLPSEMLDQIYRIQTSIGERISNVVVMGTGEPLDNYDNLLRFCLLYTSAIHHGEPGDIIVLAGKGHEDYQEIKGKKYPMDERVLIEEILQEDKERAEK